MDHFKQMQELELADNKIRVHGTNRQQLRNENFVSSGAKGDIFHQPEIPHWAHQTHLSSRSQQILSNAESNIPSSMGPFLLSHVVQVARYTFFAVVGVPVSFALWTFISSVSAYFRGLNRLPRPPLPANPLAVLFKGHGLIRQLFLERGTNTIAYLNCVHKSLRSSVFVLFGPLFTSNVFVTSTSGLRAVALASPGVFTKPKVVRAFVTSFTGKNSVFLADGPQHRLLRHAISAALKHDNLVKLGPYFLKRGDSLTKELANSNNQQDPVFIIRRATFDIIIVACFGHNVISEHDMERLLHLYHESLLENSKIYALLALISMTLPFIPSHWLSEKERCKIKLKGEVHRLCNDVIQNYKKRSTNDTSDLTSLLSVMMDACEDGQFTTEDLETMVLSLLLAGQATTTISIAWTIHLLACHQDWQEQVYDELRLSWKPSGGVDALDKLPLLHRVVKEAIRLYPPVPYFLRTPVRDVSIDGHKISAGTFIRIPVAAMQRRPDVWGADADLFNPDRFIVMDRNDETRWLWSAFWYGAHSCIGQRFAMLEIKAFVASLISKYVVSVDIARDGRPSHIGTDQTPRDLKFYYEPRILQGS